ncbi:MAG: HYC_CC_PP family protein [Chitinophagales bacterium]
MKTIRTYHHLTTSFMVVLFLFSSIGISLDMHYCGGQLKHISWLGEAKSCHEIAAQQQHCKHKQAIKQQHCSASLVGQNADCQKNCCSNEQVYLVADVDILSMQITNFQVKGYGMPLHLYAMLTFLEHNSSNFIFSAYQNYKPPLLNRYTGQKLPLIQSFLL